VHQQQQQFTGKKKEMSWEKSFNFSAAADASTHHAPRAASRCALRAAA
jgi:hypothetical protein